MTATALVSTWTTFLTPFMPVTLAASKLFTLPPNTGQSLIAAFSMPGSVKSIAYIILPTNLVGGVEPLQRLAGDLPILRVLELGLLRHRQLSGSFRHLAVGRGLGRTPCAR